MIPFVAFGFIDRWAHLRRRRHRPTVGVAFGLSSLAAAAGQSSATKRCAAGAEDMVLRLGLTLPQLTPEQQLMRATRFASTAGKVVGVISGCTLGLGNLLFIDTLAVEKAKEEKEYTAIFRAIMHKGHEVAECAAAALGISANDKREIWTRAAHGNRLSNLPIRRPFGVGIVGSVAETGELSNVTDAYSAISTNDRQGRHHRVHEREHTDVSGEGQARAGGGGGAAGEQNTTGATRRERPRGRSGEKRKRVGVGNRPGFRVRTRATQGGVRRE